MKSDEKKVEYVKPAAFEIGPVTTAHGQCYNGSSAQSCLGTGYSAGSGGCTGNGYNPEGSACLDGPNPITGTGR